MFEASSTPETTDVQNVLLMRCENLYTLTTMTPVAITGGWQLSSWCALVPTPPLRMGLLAARNDVTQ